ncbi:flavodoxin domain-containing protein [Geodermatophilus sp. SYSU D00684]
MAAATRVLVCYASATGSTRGIAERIADRIRSDLRGRGLADAQVVCRPAGPDVDPHGFDALVVGSAVHDMAWLPAATSFLGRASGAAAPVWVFSVGGSEPRDPLTRRLVARERARIERTLPAGFAPRDHRVFGGIVVLSGAPVWGRLSWRLVGGRPRLDHRDWPAIEAWAAGIATEVASAARPTAATPSGQRPR